jgi:curved DNA-binding protein
MSIHHKTLEIDTDASAADIKTAYRRMASKHHPDKDGGSDEKFQEIQEAYDRLSHPEKYKEEENRFRHQPGPAYATNFGDMFEHMRRQREQQPITVRMGISLESTLHDQKRNLDLTQHNIAPTQINIPAGIRHGESVRYNVKLVTPDNYSASQINVQFLIDPHAVFQVSGEHLGKQVTVDAFDAMLGCEIIADTLDNKTLKVKLPAGSQPGTKLKIPGAGLVNRTNKKRGDLYIVVNISTPVLTEEEKEIITNLRETHK